MVQLQILQSKGQQAKLHPISAMSLGQMHATQAARTYFLQLGNGSIPFCADHMVQAGAYNTRFNYLIDPPQRLAG